MTESGLVVNRSVPAQEGDSVQVGHLIDPLSLAASSSTVDTPARSTSILTEVDGGTINPNAQSHSLAPVHTLAESSSTAPTPGTSTSILDVQTSEGNMALIHSTSSTISPLAIETPLGLKPGTQTITASPKSQNGQTLNPGSTITLGSGFSTTIPSLQVFGSQTPLVSASSTSQILPSAATPALPGLPTILTDGGNAMTTNSFGHSSIDNQILTPGGVITVSGTLISLTPNQSDVVVGTYTGGLGTNFTGGLTSGPKATGTQTFKGDALGMRNDLCGSSMVMLVGIALLLWLR